MTTKRAAEAFLQKLEAAFAVTTTNAERDGITDPAKADGAIIEAPHHECEQLAAALVFRSAYSAQTIRITGQPTRTLVYDRQRRHVTLVHQGEPTP